MANQFFRQNQPGPVCDRVNTWSYGLIALRTGNTEQAAKNAAKAEAEQKAQQALNNERQTRDGRCPNPCQGGRLGGNTQPVLKSILTYNDTDRNLWVAYYSARWKSQLECQGRGNRVSQNFATASKSLSSAGADPACGKTRFYSGCTLGTASGSSKGAAKNAAENAAKATAQQVLDVTKNKNCPNNCGPGQKAAPDKPSTIKLDAFRIFQVTPTTWVGYAVAYWTVSITCPIPAKPKKKAKQKPPKKSKSKSKKRSSRYMR